MGWLFACFGYTNKRKRPRKASKFGCKSRRIRSYQALKSESDAKSVSGPVSTSNLELREEPKDEKKARIRKKVRFNLDVIAYEPIPTDDASTNSQEDEIDNNWDEREEKDDEQAAEKVGLVFAASHTSVSSNRYSNCYEQDDEDDDVECELSDLEDDDEEEDADDDDDEDDDNDYGNGEWLIDPRKIYHEEIAEEHQRHCPAINSSEDADLGISNGLTKNTRFRSHYVVPVLNPIENLSQWKALKERKC